jgi:hypothetical protein
MFDGYVPWAHCGAVKIAASRAARHWLAHKGIRGFTEVTQRARFHCGFDLLLGILKSLRHEVPLLNRRRPAFRPFAGAVCAAGVGQTDGLDGMPGSEGAIPRQPHCHAGRWESGTGSVLQTRSTYSGAPPASKSRQEDQHRRNRNSFASIRCGGTLSAVLHGMRAREFRRPQSAPRPPFAVLGLSSGLVR